MTYTATLGIKETARNVKDFIKANNETFMDILKPLLPYIIGGYFVDMIATHFLFEPDSDYEFFLGSIVASYFTVALAISWHRVILLGADRAEPMNPFKPQKHELGFIFMGVGIAIGLFVMVALIAGVSFALGPAGLVIGMPVAVLLAYFLFYKFSFYFPAKAVDSSISLKQSFSLTKGYIWKMLFSYLLAAVKPILIIFVYVFAVMFTLGIIFGLLGMGDSFTGLLSLVITFIVMLPVYAYFQPLLTIIAVSILSNYYQHALQNKPLPAEPEKQTDGDMNKARKALDKESKF